ncbi:hypothetical protein BURPS1106B_1481 [Burkholderia pseudomallei 1106b]|nr:hypothetical protein BURPS1106A_A0517 [Burkholderia pseudomallei 1106a]EEH24819.1 conserved hypothetical protein [Burkholderia pseudomallei Pakistan 9]EEP49893.1 conserved hypothetical protein [Burkholderia pseudomallei MSHR346]EES21207.1 hypothetical protein BURPS1106B_1481 [Burkholderia pseudomallei 1106b]
MPGANRYCDANPQRRRSFPLRRSANGADGVQAEMRPIRPV